MDHKLLDSYYSEQLSECSCCYDDIDSSDCSCCSCDCDSTCSSCSVSPTYVYTNSKLDDKVLKQFHFIEELSKSCENSDDHVLLYNFKDLSKKRIKLGSGLKESDDDSNSKYVSTNHHSGIPSLHSKQLQQELLEIENLLCDTSLDSNSGSKKLSGGNFTPRLSDSHSLFSSSTASPNVISFNGNSSFHGTGNLVPDKSLNSWPSGFNAPKYRFSDSDYNDPDKLFSMLISLDLYSYMFVVENVLDQLMKQELSHVEVSS